MHLRVPAFESMFSSSRDQVIRIIPFVYVDYGHSSEELDDELVSPGFRGYEVIAKRNVTERKLAPHGWTPSFPSPADGDPSRYYDWMKKPFCSWIIPQRLMEMPASHGPDRFSFL